uniref:Uncharacterized protein n=1 Tax=Heterorhabditis bacteriophora TaxID=37862 RepID=A0A1I7XKP1_HETBA
MLCYASRSMTNRNLLILLISADELITIELNHVVGSVARKTKIWEIAVRRLSSQVVAVSESMD